MPIHEQQPNLATMTMEALRNPRNVYFAGFERVRPLTRGQTSFAVAAMRAGEEASKAFVATLAQDTSKNDYGESHSNWIKEKPDKLLDIKNVIVMGNFRYIAALVFGLFHEYGVTFGSEDVLDFLQNAYVKLVKVTPKFKSENNAHWITFATTVIKNMFRSEVKSNKRRNIFTSYDAGTFEEEPDSDALTKVLETNISEMSLEELDSCLQNIPNISLRDVERQVLIFMYAHLGMRHKELAMMLNMSRIDFDRHIYTARKKLRQMDQESKENILDQTSML